MLYFGLTSQQLKTEDVFNGFEMFSPLAKINRSFYSKGIDIQVNDNPAGRPHVTISKL